MENRDVDMEEGELDQNERSQTDTGARQPIIPVVFNDTEELCTSPLPESDLLALYTSLELPEEEVNCVIKQTITKTPNWVHRYEAIHLRGTEEMSTNDIFDYFNGYKPASIEWINDSSCNAVWLDAMAAAKAMLAFSDEIIKNTKEPSIDEDSKEAEDKSLPEIPVPPGVWRKGKTSAKSKIMLMRFATKNDKKVRGAEKLSRYYQKYGNPNYGGMRGLISNSKKRRLRGDQKDKKNPWGSLAEEWGDGEDLEERFLSKQLQPPSLTRCLGRQPRPSPSRSGDDGSSDSQSDSDESERQGGKRPRMRMYADEEEKKSAQRISKQTAAVDWGERLSALRQRTSIEDAADSDPLEARNNDLRNRLKRRKQTESVGGVFDLRNKLKNRSMPMEDE